MKLLKNLFSSASKVIINICFKISLDGKKRTEGFWHEHNVIQRNLLCRMTFSYTTTGILDKAVGICIHAF